MRFLLGLWISATLGAQNQALPHTDDLIIPGVRVGPVTRASTKASLRKQLGKAVVERQIATQEGMESAFVLYDDDPSRRLAVLWSSKKPEHPDIVLICYGEVDRPCRWHTPSGIGIGTSLKDLEQRNGKPFQVMVWGTDLGGRVAFPGGRLEQELRGLSIHLSPRITPTGAYIPPLTPEESDAVNGEKILDSGHTVLQKLNPYIRAMDLVFAPHP